jgi:hypothetical protein
MSSRNDIHIGPNVPTRTPPPPYPHVPYQYAYLPTLYVSQSNVRHATVPVWDAIVPRLGVPQTSVFDRLAPPVQDRLGSPQSGQQT